MTQLRYEEKIGFQTLHSDSYQLVHLHRVARDFRNPYAFHDGWCRRNLQNASKCSVGVEDALPPVKERLWEMGGEYSIMVLEGSTDGGFTWRTVAHVPFCMWGTSFVAKETLYVLCVRQARKGNWATSPKVGLYKLNFVDPLSLKSLYGFNHDTYMKRKTGFD